MLSITHTYVLTYICVCVCVCVRARVSRHRTMKGEVFLKQPMKDFFPRFVPSCMYVCYMEARVTYIALATDGGSVLCHVGARVACVFSFKRNRYTSIWKQ